MKISQGPKNKIQILTELEKEIDVLELKARDAKNEEEFNVISAEQNKKRKEYRDLLNMN